MKQDVKLRTVKLANLSKILNDPDDAELISSGFGVPAELAK